MLARIQLKLLRFWCFSGLQPLKRDQLTRTELMTSIIEQWKPVPGYEGLYEVSDQGSVKTLHGRRWNGNHWGQVPFRLMKQTVGRQGYPVVRLTKDGKGKTCTVHTLVLLAFVGPKPPGQECRHLNGNREDPRLCNLAWGLPIENTYDRIKHGTMPRGIKHHKAKLTEDQIRQIRKATGTHRSIGAKFGISTSLVSTIKSGKSWAHIQ